MPTYTTPPGGKTRPESINETEPLMRLHTGDDILIWHTDGARCYRHLPLNTRVKHSRKIWTAVRQLELSDGDVLTCYGGTELQDGLWTHLKKHIPHTMNTNCDGSLAKIEQWAKVWAWRHRRSGIVDLFCELGEAVRVLRGARG